MIRRRLFVAPAPRPSPRRLGGWSPTTPIPPIALFSLSSPCADAMSRARALRDSPRCVVFSAVRGIRLGWSPIRCRASAPTLRSEPRFPSPRTLRGFRSLSPPSPPPHTLSLPLSPPLPDGVTSSEPRSVRADGIPGSERYAATAPRPRSGRWRVAQTGGGRAVHSTRPSCGACEISRPRQHGPPV